MYRTGRKPARRQSGLLVAALMLLFPFESFAWGRTGHHIVAQIAMSYLHPSTRDKVIALLDKTSPEDAATWMDDIQVSPDYDHMRPWHYIHIPKGGKYEAGQTGNIITALQRAYDDIRLDRVDERKRKEALMILFHLIGDLHQPLHVGYESDRGGNNMRINFEGKSTNLHQVWDSDLIGILGINAKDILKAVGEGRVLQAEIETMRQGDFVHWMSTGRSSLEAVYDFSGTAPDPAYKARNKRLLETLLFTAGIRLAHTLETLLGGEAGTAGSAGKVQAMGSYTPEQALQHIGETVTVCGKVFGRKGSGRGKPAYLDLGAPFPGGIVSVMIRAEDLKNFYQGPEIIYNNMDVCVSGPLSANGKGGMITISKEDQIEIR